MLLRATVLFVLFVIGSGVIARAQRTEQVPPRQALNALPMTIGDWRGRPDRPMTAEAERILGADDYLLRTYFGRDAALAGLYIGFWETQKRGATVHSPLNCLPGSGWEPLSHRNLEVRVASDSGGTPRVIGVNRYVIQKGTDRLLVLYWYQSHGRVIASEYWGKFYLVADSLRMNRSDTGIVRVTAPIANGTPAAEAAAERVAVEFVQQIFPTLGSYIPS